MKRSNHQATLIEQDSRAHVGQRSRKQHLFWFARVAACGVLLALGLALLIQQVVMASHQPSDFCQEYIAAQRLAQGAPVYQLLSGSTSYSNCPPAMTYDAHPPPSALLAYPLSFLPYQSASLIWGFCALAALLASGLLLLQALGWRSLTGIALFVIGCACWQPVIGAEGAQNLWQFLMLLIVLAWLLERRGHAGWAGALLGLAGLLKLWPALLLLRALPTRQWRLALAGGATLVLGTALTVIITGPGAYAAYLGPVQDSEGSLMPVIGNISLVSMVARCFTGQPPLLPPLAPGLSFQAATLLGEGAAGFLLLGTLAAAGWYRWRAPGEATDLLCQGLFVTAALLAFPLIWYFGLITLLLPCAATILALRQLPRPPRWWFALLLPGLLSFLAPYALFTLGGSLLEQRSPGSVWVGMGLFALPTIGLLLCAAMQGYLLHHARVRGNA